MSPPPPDDAQETLDDVLPEDEGAGLGVPPDSLVDAPGDRPSKDMDTRTPDEAQRDDVAEGRALGIAASVAVLVIAYVASPVGVGMLLGALAAFVLQPLYERIRQRTKRPRLAAFACVGLSGLVITSSGWLIGYLLVSRGAFLAGRVASSLAPGGPGRALVEGLTSKLQPIGIKGDDLVTKLRDAASGMVESAATVVATVASGTFSALLALFFLMLTMHFVLRHGTALAARMEDMFPLHPRHTRALVAEIRKVGRQVLLGTLVTGLAQGILAFVGYWVSGLPEAAFFGALTAVASLLPGVGTLLIWVPAGVFLLLTGHGAAGAFLLVWGTLIVVGVSDYIIRPRFVGHGEMPALLTFAALFGGVEVFGISGLLWGPLLVALAVAVLRIHATESEGRAARELLAWSASWPQPSAAGKILQIRLCLGEHAPERRALLEARVVRRETRMPLADWLDLVGVEKRRRRRTVGQRERVAVRPRRGHEPPVDHVVGDRELGVGLVHAVRIALPGGAQVVGDDLLHRRIHVQVEETIAETDFPSRVDVRRDQT